MVVYPWPVVLRDLAGARQIGVNWLGVCLGSGCVARVLGVEDGAGERVELASEGFDNEFAIAHDPPPARQIC